VLPSHSSHHGCFGADLDDIRIHRSAASDSLNRASGSLAFAVDNHIGFKTGFDESYGELFLCGLAHELVHVLQKRRARKASKQTLGSAWVLEEEADRIACEVLRGTHRLFSGMKQNWRRLRRTVRIAAG
jgi:hypothetical protein